MGQLVKNLLAMLETWVWRSPGEGKGYPLQYSGLENSMNCIVHGVAKSRTWLSNFHSHSLTQSLFSTKRISFQLYVIDRKLCWNGEKKVKVAQLCPTLCDPMGYTVHGILQGRMLEWVAFPFSRGSSQTRDWTQVSCIAGGFFTSWATREAQEIWSG